MSRGEAFAKYHEERAGHGGAGREFHERAASFLRTADQELAAARAEGRREGFERAREMAADIAAFEERTWRAACSNDGNDPAASREANALAGLAASIRVMRPQKPCAMCGHVFHDDNACPACRPGTCTRSDS